MNNPLRIWSAGIVAGVLYATACVVPALSATHTSVVSARQFIGSFTASPKTELVASNGQRTFVVSASKAADVLNTASDLTLTEFPVATGTDGVVELRRARPIIDGRTVCTINGSRPYTPPAVQTFRGRIQGQEKSKVVLTIIDGNMTGMIQHEDGSRYIMSPAVNSRKDAREHMLYNERSVTLPPGAREFRCLTPDVLPEEREASSSGKFGQERPLSNDLLVVDLALDVDFSLFEELNPDPETADPINVDKYVFPLIAMVSSIYEDEINTTFHISYYNIWFEESPYEADGDISVMLDKFADYWDKNNRGVTRAVAHLLTGSGSTQVGGIAYRDELCNRTHTGGGGGFSVSGLHATYTYPTLDYTWDVNVVAHEIGHNFASPHTHMCGFWSPAPLDTCVDTNPGLYFAGDACEDSGPARPAPGSIMSYCHLRNDTVPLTFTAPVVQVIRDGAERAKCVYEPASPVVLLQHPLGNQIFRAGTPVTIRWTSADVTMVGLQYSDNNGQSWNSVADAVSAIERRYDWVVPSVASSDMLIRIYDVNDQTVADTSMVTFETGLPALAVIYPVGGERFSQHRTVTLKWNGILVESVAVDFRRTAGAEWQTLQTGLTGGSHVWTVPEVTTSDAVVRVRDESDDQIIAQSQPFAIGAAGIAVQDPTFGTEWLVNSQQNIRWSADFVDAIQMLYTTDSTEGTASNWNRIGPFSVDATQTAYTWKVPDVETTTAMIKIYNRTPGAAPYVVYSPHFTITRTVSVRENLPAAPVLSLVPQPAGEQVTVRYTLEAPAQLVRITVRDMTGRSFVELRPQEGMPGEHSVSIATSALAQGVYFVTIDADGAVTTRPLTVLH